MKSKNKQFNLEYRKMWNKRAFYTFKFKNKLIVVNKGCLCKNLN